FMLNSQRESSLPQCTQPEGLTDRDPLFSTSNKSPVNSLTQRQSPTSSPSSKPSKATPPVDDSVPIIKKKELPLPSGPKNNGNKKEETQKRGMISWEKFIISLETTAFVCIMGFLIASLMADRLQDSTIWGLEIWKWCLLMLAILCGRLTAYLITNVLMSLIWKFWLDERVLYFAHGVKKSILLFIWLGLVTLDWDLLFNRRAKRRVTRGLAGCLIGVTLWQLKTLLVKLIGSTMRELMNAIRGKRLLPLSYHRNVENNKNIVENITDLEGEKIASDDIFTRLAGSNNTEGYMDLKTLMKFVEDDKVIQHLMGVAEDKQNPPGDEENNTEQDKQIKRSVLRNWVVHDSRNSTLQQSKTAIDELNLIASVIILFVIIITWLLFMEYLSAKVLLFMSTQLLLAVFMFGSTVKNLFEAVIFVFVVHAFHVGDRCVIDGMVVDEMNILTATFLRYDGEKIYYPNSVLAVKPVSNLYRSPPMSECLEFDISLRTSMKIINDLQEKIKKYLESNPRRWQAEHSVQFMEIEDVNKMKVALYVNHTINFHHIVKRGKRRPELVLEMKRIFEELKIEYNLLPQQVTLSYAGSAPSAPPFPVRR
ncbi:hypothetical protein P3X46_019588, partial [Hevea brasiliensis]